MVLSQLHLEAPQIMMQATESDTSVVGMEDK